MKMLALGQPSMKLIRRIEYLLINMIKLNKKVDIWLTW